jgi:hypothetical protein
MLAAQATDDAARDEVHAQNEQHAQPQQPAVRVDLRRWF